MVIDGLNGESRHSYYFSSKSTNCQRYSKPGSVLIWILLALGSFSIILGASTLESGRIENCSIWGLRYTSKSEIIGNASLCRSFPFKDINIFDTAVGTQERLFVLQVSKFLFGERLIRFKRNRLMIAIPLRRNRSAKSGQLIFIGGNKIELWLRRVRVRYSWKDAASVPLSDYAGWSVPIDFDLIDDSGDNVRSGEPQWRLRIVDSFNQYPSTFGIQLGTHRPLGSLSSFTSLSSLFRNSKQSEKNSPCCDSLGPTKQSIPTWQVPCGIICAFIAIFVRGRYGEKPAVDLGTFFLILVAGALILMGYIDEEPKDQGDSYRILPRSYTFQHDAQNCITKTLDSRIFM